MAGGYVGEIQEKFTQQIFDALDAGTPITIKLTYDLGERETLVMTARGWCYQRFYPPRPVPRVQRAGTCVPGLP
jgi:hypothetical protein